MSEPVVHASSWPAIGTTVTVVAPSAAALDRARAVAEAELDALDRACSRFRPDSELTAVNSRAGTWVTVSQTCAEVVEAALRVAGMTSGLVDPTVGRAVRLLGYDDDFDVVARRPPAPVVRVGPAPGWRGVRIDPAGRRLRVPAGVELDLGATAKAWCADRTAARAAAETGAGVVVNLGGDLALGGPPPGGGWAVRIADDHTAPRPGDPVVDLAGGGLATSSTVRRAWARGTGTAHHVVDPRTGEPAAGPWRTVSVAAGTCVDANAAATAALVLGPAAPGWLAARGLPSRLVHRDGRITTVAGWPADRLDARPAS